MGWEAPHRALSLMKPPCPWALRKDKLSMLCVSLGNKPRASLEFIQPLEKTGNLTGTPVRRAPQAFLWGKEPSWTEAGLGTGREWNELTGVASLSPACSRAQCRPLLSAFTHFPRDDMASALATFTQNTCEGDTVS
jgi:hypothetical protein